MAETFLVNELRKQATWAEADVQLYHYRDSRGHHEVDVIAEAASGEVVGVGVHGFVVYLGQRIRAADLPASRDVR